MRIFSPIATIYRPIAYGYKKKNHYLCGGLVEGVMVES